jgi:glucokinase
MQSTESFFGKAASGKSGGEARHLAAGIAARDPAAQSILGELALNLALALSHVVHLMHPEVIVIGGGLSLIGESLRKAIEEALPRLVIEAFHPAPQIRLALLGEDAVPVGAMQLARMQLGAKRSAAMGAAGLPLQSVSSHAIQTP